MYHLRSHWDRTGVIQSGTLLNGRTLKALIAKSTASMLITFLKTLKRSLQYFTPRQSQTRDEMERGKDIVIVEAAMESQEMFLVEGSTFVGATGTFDGVGHIDQRPARLLPTGYRLFDITVSLL